MRACVRMCAYVHEREERKCVFVRVQAHTGMFEREKMCVILKHKEKAVLCFSFFLAHTMLISNFVYDAAAVYPDSGDDCPGGGENKATTNFVFFLRCS